MKPKWLYWGIGVCASSAKFTVADTDYISSMCRPVKLTPLQVSVM